jgi:UDP-N-acetylglucosamine:LPS N-acetylglucosamine transferase
MNIGFISLGSSGTMGHFSLIKNIIKNFYSTEHNLYIISEYDYKNYALFENTNINFITVPKQKMTYSVAGKLQYNYWKDILKIIASKQITHVFYSTFFDENLIKETTKLGTKSFLISYPLRDTHERIVFGKNYLNFFEKYIILKDIYNPNQYSDPKVIMAKIMAEKKNMDLIRKNKVLVTIGGGGRPSSTKFLKLVLSATEKFSNVEFIFLLGAYNKMIIPVRKNIIIVHWSNNIHEYYSKVDFVISEAGFFTVNELSHIQKPALLIPGYRTIDNQELRAVEWELNGCGAMLLRESQKTELPQKIQNMIEMDFNTLQKNFVNILKTYDKYPLVSDVIKDLIK